MNLSDKQKAVAAAMVTLQKSMPGDDIIIIHIDIDTGQTSCAANMEDRRLKQNMANAMLSMITRDATPENSAWFNDQMQEVTKMDVARKEKIHPEEL